MSQEQVLKTLVGLGLTRLDSQVYIYLSKRGPQKGQDLSKGLKVQKQQLYRSLKNLQSKGIVNATLEHPARFNAVSFDKVVDIFIKAKMAEAQQIQEQKTEILANWQAIAIGETIDTAAKFNVIEGRGPIYAKILQMMKEAKDQLSAISTVAGLLRADQFGLFDAGIADQIKSKIRFRALTELSQQDLSITKNFLKDITKAKISFEARTPDLSLSLPQMVIRDEEDALFFITPKTKVPSTEQEDVCLWTNCKSLVQAFMTVFEELWHNSSNIQSKIVEIETGKPLSKTYVFANADQALDKYDKSIRSALKEIIILTSSQSLIEMAKQDQLIANWAKKQIAVRIMSPITRNTVNAVRQLSKSCQVKHVPVGCQGTTIVDGKEMFQFNHPSDEIEPPGSQYFENAFYSNDLEYVEKTSKMLDDMWRNAQDTQVPIFGSANESINGSDILAENNPYMKLIGIRLVDGRRLTEKEVLDKIIHARRLHVKIPEKDTHRIYATCGSAIIHPPSYLNLPDLMLEVAQIESQSSLGAANVLTVYQWLNTEKGIGYAPVAMVYTKAKPYAAAKQVYKDAPSGDNISLVKEDELQIRTHGNTMFAGWTNPIPLLPRKIALPPACLILEGYGKVHPIGYTLLTSYGAKSIVEQNCFDAFVTFMHPTSKYSGAGTDGFFSRDYIMTLQPPA